MHFTHQVPSLIISHPMTNSLWGALLFCHVVSTHLIPSHPILQQSKWVMLYLCLPCTLITSYPMLNSKWVSLTFSSSIKWHHIWSLDEQLVSGTLCQCQNITSCNQQLVSDCYWFCITVSSLIVLWLTASEWCHPFFSARHSHHISSHGQ